MPTAKRSRVEEIMAEAAMKIQSVMAEQLTNADFYGFHIPLPEASCSGTLDVYVLAPTNANHATAYGLKVKLLPKDADAAIPNGTEYTNSVQLDTAPDPNGGPLQVVADPGYKFYKYAVTVPGTAGDEVLLQFFTTGGSPAKLVRCSRMIKNG